TTSTEPPTTTSTSSSTTSTSEPGATTSTTSTSNTTTSSTTVSTTSTSSSSATSSSSSTSSSTVTTTSSTTTTLQTDCVVATSIDSVVCRLQALSDTIQRGPIPAGLTQSLERGTTRAELTSAKIVGLIARGRFRAARRQRHELETRV